CCAAAVPVINRLYRSPFVCQMPALETASTIRLYMTVFATGLLGIGFEVLGVRLLGQVLENTIYTFAVTLAVYLLGTALGAAIQQRRLRPAKFEPLLCRLLVGLSMGCVIGAWVLTRSPEIYHALRSRWESSPSGIVISEAVVAAAVFGLPTLFMGALFGHLVQSAKHARGGVGRAVALNTLGSAIAPALFGVMLLPRVGAKWSLVIVSLGYLVPLPRITGWSGVGAVVLAGLVALLPADMRLVRELPGSKLVEFHEG